MIAAARQRWLGAAAVLPADLRQSRRVADDAGLSRRRRHPAALAQRDAFGIESSDQFRSDPPPALTSNEVPKDYNEVKAVGALDSPERPQDRTDVARYFAVATAATSGTRPPAGERRAGHVALRECACLRAAQHGHQRRPGRVDGDEIPLRLLAADHRDSRRRHRRQPEDRRAIRHGRRSSPRRASRAIRRPMRRASYAARAIAERIFGPGGQDIALSHPGVPDVTLVLYQVPADHRRHRRCARLWRHPLPLRSGGGRAPGTPGRHLRLQEQPTPQRRPRKTLRRRRIDAAELDCPSNSELGLLMLRIHPGHGPR